MYYPEASDQARQYAEAALKLMVEHGIAPHPTNFIIWYEYLRQSNVDLVKEIDGIIGAGEKFTASKSDELFESHFGSDQEVEAIVKTSDKIQSAVDYVLRSLGDAGTDASEYGRKLYDVSVNVGEDASQEQITDMVRFVLAETKQIIQKTHKLENRLQRSSQEIVGLRENLEEAKREALVDGLTGIANRKCLDMTLRSNVTEARAEGHNLSLLLLDIDRFKRFNDTYGHTIGDHVLRVVGQTLKNSVKGRDTAARFGGEEFCVVLPQTDLSDAVTLADQIRIQLATHELKNKKTNESYGTVTVSIGAAQYSGGEAVSELLERVDRALYSAKLSGRNKVVDETALSLPKAG
ncbi:MAG: GGDEF domain-containing protein [Alphaproteobacteria bacterium]|jgi:diguanylate cyclase|nr:GGDEF domain-containing protein [Alphaproteobacteria bacterium]|tara:strand:+ start:2535 stop:3584 length:1050 start_codon:yes stop_codon:yes gene_type:complete